MAAFNLTAELNLRGPSNLNQVVGNIRRQLSTISFDLNINPSTSRGIQSITADVRDLSAALRNAQSNAVALGASLRGLGASVSNLSGVTNNLNTSFSNVSRNVNTAGSAVRAASSEMTEFGRQSALAIRRFAAFSIATGAVYALTRAISSAYGEFVNFNKEFVRLQQVTDSTATGLQSLAGEITRLSTSLGVGSQELLNVSVTLAQAGLSAGETKKALEALAKSALAPSFDSLNDTVEGSIALMRQFGISATDLEGALGSINSVAAKFAVEAGDIIAAIQRTGGVFASASKGVSQGTDALNEFIAIFTSVRATTRESAETIATGLRTIFTRIQRVGTIEALKQFGISLTDLEGKFVGPYEAVRRLSEGLKSLDPRDLRFAEIVEELGGFRQIGKVIPLIQQFETAQKALGVAQRGSGSLAADAATAQEALSVKINKVREQFVALIRDIGQSQGFQTFVDISLKLASALISVADAAKDVLPALAAITAIRGVGALGQFFSGFAGGLGRRPRGFARGGVVPGRGSGDTVPAMLTPGEFVIRKKAVDAIGANNLHRANRFASGGYIQKFAQRTSAASAGRVKPLTEAQQSRLQELEILEREGRLFGGQARTLQDLRKKSVAGQVFQDQKRKGNIKTSKEPLTFGLAALFGEGYSPSPVMAPKSKQKVILKSGILPQKESLKYQNIMIEGFKQTILKVGSKLAQGVGASIDSSEGKLDSIVKNTGIGNIVGSALEGSLGVAGAPFVIKTRENQSIDFPAGLGGISSKFGLPGSIPTDATRTAGGKGKTFNDFLGQVDRYLLKTQPRMARGGSISSEDTVPALLTPGEFVINKKAAKRIGSARLHQLNRADKVQGYNTGGPVGNVQHFGDGGGVQRFFAGGLVQAISSLIGVVSTLTARINLLGRNVPSGSGWVGGRSLSSMTRGGISRGSSGFGNIGLALTVGGGLAGDAAGQIVGGKQGNAISAAIASFVGPLGIGMMFGPLGALAGAITGAVASFNSYSQSLNQSNLEEQNQKIEGSTVKLQKTFEQLDKSTSKIDINNALNNASSQLSSIASSESQRQNLLTNQVASKGMFSWLLGSQTDTNQVQKELISSSRQTNVLESLPRVFEQGLSKGLTLEQIQASFPKGELDKLKEIFALASGNEIISGLVATREERQTRGLDTTNLDNAIKSMASRLFTNDVLKPLQDRKKIEEASAAASAAANVKINLLAQTLTQVAAASGKASASFAETQRQLQSFAGSAFGDEFKLQGPSREQENVLSNIQAYSVDQIRSVIGEIGASFKFNPALVQEAQSAASNQRILGEELPRILNEIAARGQTFDPEGSVGQVVTKKLNEVLKGSIQDPGQRGTLIENIIKRMNERLATGNRQGLTVQELAQDEKALADIMKADADVLEVFNNLLKQSNDIIGSLNDGMNLWASRMEQATAMRIEAQNIGTQADIQLRQSLGESISLSSLNQAFESSILTLTSRIGAGGVAIAGTGTLDSEQIFSRMLDKEKEARDIQKQLETEKPPIDSARYRELNDALQRSTLEARNLGTAHKKLQTDSSRAANALSKINEVRQLQEARQSSILDFLRNVNNPEAMMNLTNEIQSFFGVMSGQLSGNQFMMNIDSAVRGLERQLAVLSPEDQDKVRGQFIESAMRQLAQIGNFSPEQLRTIRAMLEKSGTSGQISPEMKGLIDEFYKYTKVQQDAVEEAAKRTEGAAQEAARLLIEGARTFVNIITAAGQQNPIVPVPLQSNPGRQTVGRQYGGIIYANKGKYVNFEPRGTDTVPAMLTPGEFVVNAKATKKNKNLLHAINSSQGPGYFRGGGIVMIGGRRLTEEEILLKRGKELADQNVDESTLSSADSRALHEYRMEQMMEEGRKKDAERNAAAAARKKESPPQFYGNYSQELAAQQAETIALQTKYILKETSEAQPPRQYSEPDFITKSRIEAAEREKRQEAQRAARSRANQERAKERRRTNPVGPIDTTTRDNNFGPSKPTGRINFGPKSSFESYTTMGQDLQRRQFNELVDLNRKSDITAQDIDRLQTLDPSRQYRSLNTEEGIGGLSSAMDLVGAKALPAIIGGAKYVGKGLAAGNRAATEAVENSYKARAAWEASQNAASAVPARRAIGQSTLQRKFNPTPMQRWIKDYTKNTSLTPRTRSQLREAIKRGQEGLPIDFSVPKPISSVINTKPKVTGSINKPAGRYDIVQDLLSQSNATKTTGSKVFRVTVRDKTTGQMVTTPIRGVSSDNIVKALSERYEIIKLQPSRFNKGGAVYASNGTLIPYQPRGTDTVPAMLTPGEFVVNKASAKRNMNLLRAINNGQNIGPQLFNKGGIVNPKYYANGIDGASGVGSSSGVSNISLDTTDLNASFGNFNTYVTSFSSAVGDFVAGTAEISTLAQAIGSLGNIGLREGAALMANAGVSVKDASSTFSVALSLFNTSASNLTTAINRIPTSIALNVNGSIPIAVTVTVDDTGANNVDTTALKQSIFNQIAIAINNATSGGINISTTAVSQ